MPVDLAKGTSSEGCGLGSSGRLGITDWAGVREIASMTFWKGGEDPTRFGADK